jgi:alpha-mannosidase
VPGQVLHDGSVAFLAEVPGLGLAPATPPSSSTTAATRADDRVVVTECSFTNQFLSLKWDLEGSISSIIDIGAGRQLLPTGSTVHLELAPDHPVEYDAWDLESWTRSLGSPLGGVTSVEVVDAGPLVATLRVKREFGGSTLTQWITMRAESARLDIAFEIDWYEDEKLLSLVAPLDVHAREAACDIQFGHVMRPTHSSNSWDSAKFEVCAHRYVDLAEPGFGVAVLNDGRYGHSVQANDPRGHQVVVSLLRSAKYPDPTQDHGHHRFTIALLPHGPGLHDVVRQAEALNNPLRLAAPGVADAMPAPVVEAGHPGVQVVAVKCADDGSGDLIVRLAEVCGARSALTVHTQERIGDASRCNLLEEPQLSLDTADGIVALTLRPFELVTLRLSPACQ